MSAGRLVLMFRERILPSPWNFAVTLLFIPGGMLALTPISQLAGIIGGLVLWGGAMTFLLVTSPVVEVTADTFTAGRGRIERRYLGKATAFSGQDALDQTRTKLDARAFLVIRGWVKDVVKVELNDPNDPTPYWLVSSRKAPELAAALNARSK